jgi:hypothetical protein
MDERSVGRILRAMNFVKMTARPRHHAQNQWALEDFKKGAVLDNADWALLWAT